MASTTSANSLRQQMDEENPFRTSLSNQNHSDVGIFLQRAKHTKRSTIHTFHPNDLVSGFVKLSVKDGWSHSGIYVTILGEITFPESGSNQLMEKILFSNDASTSSSHMQAHQQHPQYKEQIAQFLKTCDSKKIRLLELTMPLLPKGKVSFGVHEIPFSFSLQPMVVGIIGGIASSQEQQENIILYETFHGDLVSIKYNLHVVINRGFFSRQLECCLEIQVENPCGSRQKADYLKAHPQSVSVQITELDLVVLRYGPQNNCLTGGTDVIPHQLMPHFDVEVQLHSLALNLNNLLNGKLIIHSCNWSIRSISVYLRRIERLNIFQPQNASNKEMHLIAIPLKESEKVIQRLQVVYGDARRKMEISFIMEFPNLITSPTTNYCPLSPYAAAASTTEVIGFQIEYVISISILFVNQSKAEKFIPIMLFRG